jgi:hypothetical protein
MFNKKTIRDIDVQGKRVLVRVDYNVPVKEGVVGMTPASMRPCRPWIICSKTAPR